MLGARSARRRQRMTPLTAGTPGDDAPTRAGAGPIPDAARPRRRPTPARPGPRPPAGRPRRRPSAASTRRTRSPGGHVTVLAYGEISAALTTDDLPGLVCKRMAGYPDAASVSAYLDLVDEYLAELAAAGVSVVPTEAIPVQRPGRPPVVYLVQPRMDPQTLGHKPAARDRRRRPGRRDPPGARFGRPAGPAQRRADGRGRGGPRRPAVELVVPRRRTLARASPAPGAPSRGPPQPVLLDVGTPFVRRHGRHSLDARVVVAPAPPGHPGPAAALRRRLLPGRLLRPPDRRRGPAGQLPQGGGPAADRRPAWTWSTEWLATADIPGPRDPITAAEVADYYRRDARLLGLFLQARRADRAIRTKVLRQHYDFLLPGRVAR